MSDIFVEDKLHIPFLAGSDGSDSSQSISDLLKWISDFSRWIGDSPVESKILSKLSFWQISEIQLEKSEIHLISDIQLERSEIDMEGAVGSKS